MEKIMMMFPGVGSQQTGMGKDFYENRTSARDVMDEACDILSLNLLDYCFGAEHVNPQEHLEYIQCAIFAVNMACYAVYQSEIGVTPNLFLGYSLGEYCALCAAGILTYEDAIQLVLARGRLVKEQTQCLNGAMMWFLNVEISKVKEICQKMLASGEELYISEINTVYHCSISGTKQACYKAAAQLEDIGAVIYPLNMSGPYHCPLMNEAGESMRKLLEDVTFGVPSGEVLANYDAHVYPVQREGIKNRLISQLTSPIRWRECVEYSIRAGITIAIESGPKNVLQYLVGQETKQIRTFGIENLDGIKTVSGYLER